MSVGLVGLPSDKHLYKIPKEKKDQCLDLLTAHWAATEIQSVSELTIWKVIIDFFTHEPPSERVKIKSNVSKLTALLFLSSESLI